MVLTILVGGIVGGNFALAKYVVLQGASPFTVFFWQVSGAALLLFGLVLARGPAQLKGQMSLGHLRYYFIGGLLGISIPQVLGYMALREVPAGLFTMAVTVSPLFTFLAASAYERRLLPLHRILGLLIGLSGVLLATVSGIKTSMISGTSLLLLGLVPVFLAVTNVFRDKAYPAGGEPTVLAAGTLISQVILLAPFVLELDEFQQSMPVIVELWPHVTGLMVITALSYILTFELYRHTDGVGFSQVGYFVILSGAAAGALVFGEKITGLFAVSVVMLFLGVAIGNGSLTITNKLKKSAG